MYQMNLSCSEFLYQINLNLYDSCTKVLYKYKSVTENIFKANGDVV